MKKIDRFILKSFAGPFVAILLVVIFILMMQFLWLYIDELVGKGLGLRVIAEFLLWGSCTMLPLSLPLATLLSSMMTIGQLGENSELLAMKASGISVTRVMRPIFITCAVVSVAALFIVNDLVPYATNKIYTLRDDIGKTKSEIKIPVGVFYDGIDGYVLRIGGRNGKTGMMYDVMVYDHSAHKGNTSTTVADSGIIRMSKAKDYLTFLLYDGNNYQETNTRKYRDTTFALQKISFARQELIIPLDNYAFERSDTVRFSDAVKSMNFKRLRAERDSLQKDADIKLEEHLKDVRKRMQLSFAGQLNTEADARPAAWFDYSDSLASWGGLSARTRGYEAAVSNVKQFEMTLQTYTYESFKYTTILTLAKVEIANKFAQALACLILFFIGAPMGALIRKGGLGTSAIVSVLFFLLWWVIYITGVKIAKDGGTSAFTGTFAANIVLLAIGSFLTYKAIHDSTIFGGDTFKSQWRKYKSKIMSLFKKTRIVYMGTPEFAVAPLDALISNGYEVAGVVTAPDRPGGRGLRLTESPVKKYAAGHGLPILQPEKLKDPEFLEALAAWKADLFVVVGFRMLPEAVWTMPKLGTFNLHASLLPQYRGAAPINWAIINGENMTGVTTFMIDRQIDTGGIILRQECRIEAEDTFKDLHDKLMRIGADLVLQTVDGIIQNNVETRVQRSFIQGSETLKPAPKLTKELCRIDWTDSTKRIYNLIRGLSPDPVAFTGLVPAGEPDAEPMLLKIFFGDKVTGEDFEALRNRCRPGEETAPGDILSDGKSVFAIATADGAISVRDLQLQGKKRMDVKAFLAGFRNPGNYRAAAGTSKAETDRALSLQ